jgi:hypothetical protein
VWCCVRFKLVSSNQATRCIWLYDHLHSCTITVVLTTSCLLVSRLDFLAVTKLIKDITTCLQSVDEAKSEYQELIQEFEALDAALRHLDHLGNNTTSTISIESIKCAALSCRVPLKEFLIMVQRYENSLGIWNQSKPIKRTTDKLR